MATRRRNTVRRRRRSSARQASTRGNAMLKGAAVMVMAGALIYVLLAGSFGSWLAEKFIVPWLGGAQTTLPPITGTPTATPKGSVLDSTPQVTPDATEQETVKQDITFPALDYYALQVGAYSTRETAVQQAGEFKAMGGAGYILDEGMYRVFVSAYLIESDARSVRDQLVNQQGIDSYVYKSSVGALTITVTATQARITAIKDAYNAWRGSINSLEAIYIGLDRGEMTTAQVKEELEQIKQDMLTKLESMTKNVEADDASSVLDGLSALIGTSIEEIDAMIKDNNDNNVEYSSKIKYNYIDFMVRYADFVTNVTTARD